MLNVCKFPGLLSVTPSGFVTLSSKNLFPKVSMYFKLLTSKEIHAKGPEAFRIKSTFPAIRLVSREHQSVKLLETHFVRILRKCKCKIIDAS